MSIIKRALIAAQLGISCLLVADFLFASMYFVLAIYKLGHIPAYSYDPDPTSGGYPIFMGVERFLVIGSVVTLPIWLLLLLVNLGLKNFNKKLEWATFVVFMLVQIQELYNLSGFTTWYYD